MPLLGPLCRLFYVNRNSKVRTRLVISTQPLPTEQGTHCALQLLIVIISRKWPIIGSESNHSWFTWIESNRDRR